MSNTPEIKERTDFLYSTSKTQNSKIHLSFFQTVRILPLSSPGLVKRSDNHGPIDLQEKEEKKN